MSRSIQNFSPIIFFCKKIFNVFCFRKNRFRIDSFNFEYLWCDYAKKFSNGFWIYKTLNISLQKNVMGLKFCMEVDISSADENLIKRIKKVWRKKSSCRGSNQDLNETNGYFKFPRHPQKLVQNNNWFTMVNSYF